MANVPGQDVALDAVTCATARQCVATGTDQPPNTAEPAAPVPVEMTSNDGGQNWTERPQPPGGDYMGTVFCSADGKCLAAGAPAPRLSQDFGATWQLAPRSDGFGADVTSIACSTSTTCTAVGGTDGPSNGAYTMPFAYPTVATSSDGGAHWVKRPPPPGWSIDAMACPGARRCVAVGTTNAGTGGAWTTTDFGRAWERAPVQAPAQILNSVTCPSLSLCIAVGSTTNGTAIALTSNDGGARWHASALPKGLASLASVSCSNGQLCVAVGSLAVRVTVPSGGHVGIGDIEGSLGALITSSDGGKSWVSRTSSATPARSLPYFFSVACLPDLFCAVGPSYGTFLSSADGGATWDDLSNPLGYFPTTRVACANRNSCAADDTNQGAPPELFWSSDGGRAWQVANVVSPPTQYVESTWQFGALECAAQGVCIALGGDIWYGTEGLALVSGDSGRTWSTMVLPRAVSLVTAAACTAELECLATAQSPAGRSLFLSTSLVKGGRALP